MDHLLSIFVRAVFMENMAVAYFLGMCTFLAMSKKMAWRESAGGGLMVLAFMSFGAITF